MGKEQQQTPSLSDLEWLALPLHSQSVVILLNPNDLYETNARVCASGWPHLNHAVFSKLESGFDRSDACVDWTWYPYSTQ